MNAGIRWLYPLYDSISTRMTRIIATRIGAVRAQAPG
jgi:hypothetical protein